MHPTDISHLLSQRSAEVAKLLLPNGEVYKGSWRVGSIAGEKGKSLNVTIEGSQAGRWIDFANDSNKGDLIGLWKAARGITLQQAIAQAREFLGLPKEDFSKLDETPARPPIATERPETREPSKTWLRLQSNLRRGTVTELSDLATLRRLPSFAGLQLATEREQLFFADVWDDGWEYPSWILTDSSRRNAQARRTDGKIWDGIQAKAKTISGCEAGWPVGISEVEGRDIVLVEGGPDFLTAWHTIWDMGRARDLAPVAMFGASNPIHPEALPLFQGKAVWICAHRDDNLAGARAGARWRDSLLAIGARPEFQYIDAKDLNDLVAAQAKGDE